MADEKELELEKPGKKKKLIIIIAVVAILAIGGGAAFFFMSGGEDVSQAQLDAALDGGQPLAEGEESEAQKATLGSALYVPMPRPFRFNVPGAARDRFVEIRVQLLVRGGSNEEAAKKHIPLVESTLLAVFTQSNADDLATSAGKTSLKQKALAEVQKIMTEVEDAKVVEQVLFTGFVMQ
ncbi:flagellar basal body-associated protein FliL [Thalassotalea piscium]|uniref:Flagellar protein FliL n=1 Tax=Thalassotalea piscium TaxID=1230533 RepID=A0A7X0NK39_9GAMM|nr:flagellar basal body-associated protein FliL [Thalassotalea piscium]MBB6544871.1 flagellar FliL protein [Thalassotalea piscium]